MLPVNPNNYNAAYNAMYESLQQKTNLLLTGKAQEEQAFGKSNKVEDLLDIIALLLYAQMLYVAAVDTMNGEQPTIAESTFLDLNSDFDTIKRCASCRGLNLESLLGSSGFSDLFLLPFSF